MKLLEMVLVYLMEYTFLNINVMEIKVWPFLFNDAKLSFGRFPTGFVESFILEHT